MLLARRALRPLGSSTLSKTKLWCWGPLVALTLAPFSALAEPKDREAAALGKEAMDGDYLGTEFKGAEQKLQKALKLCGSDGCSPRVRAELHLNLGIVYIAGLQKKDKGNQEMQAAIEADSSVPLSRDFSTPEVEKAFAAAGGGSHAEGAKPARDEDEDEDDKPAAKVELEEEPATGSSGAVRNWFSAAFQLDFLSYQETTGVCSGAKQYQCFLQGQQYGGSIYQGSGNQLKGGIGFGTKRVLIGYERLFGENITAGGRLGFAFGGSPKAPGGAAFLPLHVEVRGSYWFGASPFTHAGFRPYAGLAGGIGEVDGHVPVEFYQDAAGYNAGAKGTLDAWRKTGSGFVALHLGAAYAFATNQQLHLELRVLQLLGQTALGGAINVGYAFGM
jgi:hypothetical protein